jgi:chemotaxis response regulator CheB
MKVLIASESVFRRNFLSEMLSSYKNIVIVENVRNNVEAVDIIEKKTPEVLVLDIEFNNTEWYKQFYPLLKIYDMKVIVLTDVDPKVLDLHDVPIILKSYEYILKPTGVWKDELPKIIDEIISKILSIDPAKIHRIDSKTRLMNKNVFIQQSQELRAKSINKSSHIRETAVDSTVIPNIEPRLEEYFLEI